MRYDAGHKRDAFIVETLAAHVRLVAVCPEVELGLGTPRETLRLEADGHDAQQVRMVMANGQDHTDAMRAFSARRVAALHEDDLDGYILKSNSPSCGLRQVRVFQPDGTHTRSGRGLYAAALLEAHPDLPVEDEGRLGNGVVRAHFIERVFANRRLKDVFGAGWRYNALVAFHTAHKMALLAHDECGYRELGRLVANGRARSTPALEKDYRALFMRTLAQPSTIATHTNVLAHMIGHLRGVLDDGARQEIVTAIERYRLGQVPLDVPSTLIREHARRLGVTYLSGQVYLEPHPSELALGNHG